ncbi:MAG: DUF2807 domain-containing protein [Bacteroidales bacterium]|nr:DUF2807 domain-containing protein [Bacteroidales bacterium]
MKSNYSTCRLILIPVVIFIIVSGCEIRQCFHSTGRNTSKEIQTGYFYRVDIEGIFNIKLVQDTVCYVEFKGGDNMLDYVNANNTDSVLHIGNSNDCYFLRDYERVDCYIHFSSKTHLNLYEVNKVETVVPIESTFRLTVQTVMAEVDIEMYNDRFSFYNNTTAGGVYTFRGTCERCDLDGYYMALIDASALIAREMIIRHYSIGDFFVNVEEKLSVEIHNSGDLIYYGSPEVVIDSVTGTGSVIPIDQYE